MIWHIMCDNKRIYCTQHGKYWRLRQIQETRSFQPAIRLSAFQMVRLQALISLMVLGWASALSCEPAAQPSDSLSSDGYRMAPFGPPWPLPKSSLACRLALHKVNIVNSTRTEFRFGLRTLCGKLRVPSITLVLAMSFCNNEYRLPLPWPTFEHLALSRCVALFRSLAGARGRGCPWAGPQCRAAAPAGYAAPPRPPARTTP